MLYFLANCNFGVGQRCRDTTMNKIFREKIKFTKLNVVMFGGKYAGSRFRDPGSRNLVPETRKLINFFNAFMCVIPALGL